jgi:hypothetical protein
MAVIALVPPQIVAILCGDERQGDCHAQSRRAGPAGKRGA